jgi:RNA polymerase sigma factor (sigma-70 family)
LYRAIAALPPHYQRIITLKFWHGLTAAEIGAALGMPPRTVDTAVANIINELKRTICFTPDFSRESSRLRYWQPPR